MSLRAVLVLVALAAVVGRELLNGRALYADVRDHKPRHLPGGHERGPFFQVSVRRGGALERRVAHAAR